MAICSLFLNDRLSFCYKINGCGLPHCIISTLILNIKPKPMIKLNDFLDEVFSFLTKLWFVFCGQRCYTQFSNYFTKKKFRFVTPFKWWWSFILHVVNKFSHMLKLQAVYEVEITRILTKIVLEIMLFGRILGIVTWCIVKYLALTLQKLIEWT